MPEQMLVVLDGCGGLGRRGEGDEAETARLAPLAVHDHHCLLCDARLDSAAGRKREQLEAQVGECESVLPGIREQSSCESGLRGQQGGIER